MNKQMLTLTTFFFLICFLKLVWDTRKAQDDNRRQQVKHSSKPTIPVNITLTKLRTPIFSRSLSLSRSRFLSLKIEKLQFSSIVDQIFSAISDSISSRKTKNKLKMKISSSVEKCVSFIYHVVVDWLKRHSLKTLLF